MPDHRTALEGYAVGARERLGPDTHASIVIRRGQQVAFAGASDERAARCDQVEVREGEGPCITAMQELHGVLVTDVDADKRWPVWADAASQAGFRSAAALPAYVDDETTIAVNLYSEDLDPWDRERLIGIDQYVQKVAEAVRLQL